MFVRDPELLVFDDLDHDWYEKHGHAQSLIAQSVCVFDFAPGKFDGPLIEEFVRTFKPKEIVLSWSLANNMEHMDKADLELRTA